MLPSPGVGTSLRHTCDKLLPFALHLVYRPGHFQFRYGSLMSELASRTCVPCRGGVPPLKGKELSDLHKQLPDFAHWKVVNEHHITRTFTFPDFVKALDFVNRIGAVAEEQGHHPDILLTWGKVEVTLWTHKVDGLTESDFIMAAKIDKLQP